MNLSKSISQIAILCLAWKLSAIWGLISATPPMILPLQEIDLSLLGWKNLLASAGRVEGAKLIGISRASKV